MDIVRCEACGKETYATLIKCPHCGRNLSMSLPASREQPTTRLIVRVVPKAGTAHGTGEFTLAFVEREFQVIDADSRTQTHSSKILYSEGRGPLQTHGLTSEETNTVRVRDTDNDEDEGEFRFPAADLDIESNDVLNCLLLQDHQGSTVVRVWNQRNKREWIYDEAIADTMMAAGEFLEFHNPYMRTAASRRWYFVGWTVCIALFMGFLLIEREPAKIGLFALGLASFCYMVFSAGHFRQRTGLWKKERLDAVRAFIDSHIEAARRKSKVRVVGDEQTSAPRPTLH